MKTSSTANLVGGDVDLEPDGITLKYWDVKVVPDEKVEVPGVISVRTGIIFFTAVGIKEDIHFKEPLRLTWAEVLANGQVGELFVNHNPAGQRFDGFPFSPHAVSLSDHKKEPNNPYMAVCGTVSFEFFGSKFINIHDAYDKSQDNNSKFIYADAPYCMRRVTIPKKSPKMSHKMTDLYLHEQWTDGRAVFDFPNADMTYNEDDQDGFPRN
jgi:hypothetical protein